MRYKFQDLDIFIKKHNFKKATFLDFLKKENIIHIINDNVLISNSQHIVINHNKDIHINTDFFYKFITNNTMFNDMVLLKNFDIPIYDIKDSILKAKSVVKASKKRLLFLDFEFVLNQYYEVAFAYYDNGILVQKGYFFEEKTLEDKFIFNQNKYSGISKIFKKKKELEKSNKKNSSFDILSRIKINNILEEILEEIDFMVVHNCKSEISILKENNIFVNKNKCICTDLLFRKEIKVYKSNGQIKEHLSLSDLVDHFNIYVDKAKLHYAYYDVELASKVFFSMVKYYKNKYK